ncbi:MAG: MBL fold metallo-hydrolase [Flavobacteriales bacterium]|jgi:hydroxyacylglutathione hydrolase|nr:MBL fold metallo-hydrolase [Flavobacteriales bacterium]MBK6549800.1 MBL fold metallo-hydrolase [Flavobacteriales bacterium]MBK6883512.1 MBL fold metallo-hydrolase [Flavobacteriales bacterium]MBK7102318.1 MBL fold metallo-hydrolase [Flavobacteriales bacterium]MBK7113056.1 MBL fold metallo-hydrolase [Flavobacteriales bacterium]
MHVAKFTFNPFQENTYVVHDSGDAVIIDPGCWDQAEREELEAYLTQNALTPSRLVLTHAHIDHIMGCSWIHDRYGLLPELHRLDLPTLNGGERTAQMFGIPYDPAPEPNRFIAEGDVINVGDDELKVLFVPGHAPGHIALHSAKDDFVISGDVLFKHSVGRVDLPGGDMDTLVSSIREQLFPLGDTVKVYCGHGPETTIGVERRSNPFLR